jgi:hypothetical protein
VSILANELVSPAADADLRATPDPITDGGVRPRKARGVISRRSAGMSISEASAESRASGVAASKLIAAALHDRFDVAATYGLGEPGRVGTVLVRPWAASALPCRSTVRRRILLRWLGGAGPGPRFNAASRANSAADCRSRSGRASRSLPSSDVSPPVFRSTHGHGDRVPHVIPHTEA